jgi:acetyl esterase/lipase
MRGLISGKLKNFIEQVNDAAKESKKNGVLLTPSLVRSNLDNLAVFIGEGPQLSYVAEKKITDKAVDEYSVLVKVYSPQPEERLPVVVHYHGGGHMCGNITLYDAISRKIAKAGHCIVIAVEYRLAPEFPYPLGLEDCQYVLEHYKEVLSEVQFNDKLMTIGDSGGGAICTTLASNNLDNNAVKIDRQILIYPSVDYTMNSASMDENGIGFLLEKEKIRWYFEHYFQAQESTVEVSPLFMPMGNTMPETLIITAGCDPLRDEGIAYKNALINSGGSVNYHSFDGMIHAYMLLDSLVEKECEETYQLIGEFIKQ